MKGPRKPLRLRVTPPPLSYIAFILFTCVHRARKNYVTVSGNPPTVIKCVNSMRSFFSFYVSDRV